MFSAQTQEEDEGDNVRNPCDALIPDRLSQGRSKLRQREMQLNTPVDDPVATKRDLGSISKVLGTQTKRGFTKSDMIAMITIPKVSFKCPSDTLASIWPPIMVLSMRKPSIEKTFSALGSIAP